MKKTILLFASLLLVGSIFAQTANENYVDGKIFFKIKNSFPIDFSINEDPKHVDINSIPFIKNLNRSFKITNLSRPFAAAKESQILQRTYLLEFENVKAADAIINQIKNNPAIDYIEKVPVRRTTTTPNDPDYSSQWALTQINAAGAWNYSTGSSTITVAIVDDGIAINHPDLAPSIWTNTLEIANNGIDDDGNGYVDDYQGFDVADMDKDPSPISTTYSHGTGVAGCAAAKSNNNIGIASIGYNIKIIPIKSTNSSVSVTHGFDGLFYAGLMKANVINMSFAGPNGSITEQNIVDYAYGRGCILVAAAGNSNSSTLLYPAALNKVIAVASTSTADVKANFSCFGSWVDICAPGENILSTAVGGTYANFTGTSFSSPIVAGLCGLMLSLNPTLTQQDVETCLKNNAINISALNPTFSGQLGAGRIDANATMACVSASLSWKPKTNFTANLTTVTVGGKVTFKDSTTNGADTWSWSFPGGSPSSFNGKTPPQITYNAIGNFNVTLTTSNANGADTKTRNAYISVIADAGCKQVNWDKVKPVPIWSGAVYRTGTNGADGFINGKNRTDGGLEIAQFYDASTLPYTKLSRFTIYLGVANSSNSANLSKVITFNVYDGSSGSPGSIIGTTTKTLSDCKKIPKGQPLDVAFANDITLPSSKKFFIGIDYSNLTWDNTTRDSLAVVSNANGQTTPSEVWLKKPANTWEQFAVNGLGWNLNISLYVFPYLTNEPSKAIITTTTTTICEGGSINFDATGSTFQDTLVWFFPGAATFSSTAITLNNIYNTAGTFPVKIYVRGGGCSEVDSAETIITVNAKPNINVNAAGSTTICPGGSVSLSASGASTYSWSPPAGLSSTNGASVVANPTTNSVYNVTGIQNGCSGSATIYVTVEKQPTVNVSVTPNTATYCKNVDIQLNASGSTDVNTYSWTITGGAPSNSTTINPTIKYNSVGTYTVSLTASNSCFSNNTYSKVFDVLSCSVGIEEFFSSDNINSYYSTIDGRCHLSIANGTSALGDQLSLRIYNNLGQFIYSEDLKMQGTEMRKSIDMNNYSKGVYIIQLVGNGGMYQRKFLAN